MTKREYKELLKQAREFYMMTEDGLAGPILAIPVTALPVYPSEKQRPGRPPTTAERIPRVFLTYYKRHAADTDFNVSECARACGISRPTVYKYLKILQAQHNSEQR